MEIAGNTAAAPKHLIDNPEDPAIKYPFVNVLAGPAFTTYSPSVLEDKILETLRDRIDSDRASTDGGIVLQGRTSDLFRIDYDPDATGCTSIQSRLRKAIATGDLEDVDYLMRPVMKSNYLAFSEVDDIEKKQVPVRRRLTENSYHSFWLHQQILKKFTPLSKSKSAAVVDYIVNRHRGLCRDRHPHSLLLRPVPELASELRKGQLNIDEDQLNHVREWSLYGKGGGFAAKVQACFDGPERSAEDYEDLLERKMYEFKFENPSAVHGPNAKKNGSQE
jgi:hypothetical protein